MKDVVDIYGIVILIGMIILLFLAVVDYAQREIARHEAECLAENPAHPDDCKIKEALNVHA